MKNSMKQNTGTTVDTRGGGIAVSSQNTATTVDARGGGFAVS